MKHDATKQQRFVTYLLCVVALLRRVLIFVSSIWGRHKHKQKGHSPQVVPFRFLLLFVARR